MKTIMITLAFVISYLVLLSLLGFYLAIRPFKVVSSITPKNFGIEFEDISFHTSDNVLIRGWFIPNVNPKAKTIILMHGYPADKGDILSSRIFLHRRYHLLFFDFRYLGQSGGSYSTLGKNEVLDLQGAIAYLHSRGIDEVGVWGLSLGGAVAIMDADQSPEIKAIVAEAPYARLDWLANEYYRLPLLRYPLAALTRLWGRLFLNYDISAVSPAKASEKLTIPILIISSKADKVIAFRHALLLQQALRHNPHAKFIFVDKVQHGEPIKDYQKIIEQFFDENLAH